MKKLPKYTLLLIINLLISICVLFVFIDSLSVKGCAYYAIFTVVLIAWCIIRVDGHRLTYSTALLCYTAATQFGLVIPYQFFGMRAVDNYSEYTLRFLHSAYLPKAILLGIVALNVFTIGVFLSRQKYVPCFRCRGERDFDFGNHKREWIVGTALLFVVFLFFAFHIITGGMKLFSTYDEFRQSRVYNSSLYSYILILFYTGTIYLASAGSVRKNWKNWMVWVVIVIIFALNGNKGEFLYALLVVLGMNGVKGKKIKGKALLLIALLIFLIIPSITTLRSVGIAGNLSEVKFSAVETFTEMGMQIRTSVYTLEEMARGGIDYLYGKSYLQPVINILTPLMPHTQATAEIRKLFPGYGYNQVIESFVNFHVPGILLFFGLTGYLIGKYEAKADSKRKLAYLGTITCILINATRNYFAFVPGQILIVTLIYFFAIRVKYVSQKQ